MRLSQYLSLYLYAHCRCPSVPVCRFVRFGCESKPLLLSHLSVRMSVCLSVTLPDHVQTVRNIKIWFRPHDALTLDDCYGTEYEVMMPQPDPVVGRLGTNYELNSGNATITANCGLLLGNHNVGCALGVATEPGSALTVATIKPI